MASLDRKIAVASRLQLVFLSLTWLAGIYVNGFVAILPGTGAGAILSQPSVAMHVVLATLTAATGVFILALAWVGGSRRGTGLSLLAVVSIVIAGDSGIGYVLGGGSGQGQSMLMAMAFIVAVFLTFFSLATVKPEQGGSLHGGISNRVTMPASVVALLLFFAVFVSGMYVNLFVAGPVYALPLAKQAAAFRAAEGSAWFMGHEAFGALLLLTVFALAASLWRQRRLAIPSLIAAILVAYSAYVGSVDLSSPPGVIGATSGGMPLLSSGSLMVALVITMLLVVRLRSESSPWFLHP